MGLDTVQLRKRFSDRPSAMHELSIVDAMIEQVKAELTRAGASGRVTRIDLVIGRLSGVCPDAVRFGFEVLARDTELESAEIVIRRCSG